MQTTCLLLRLCRLVRLGFLCLIGELCAASFCGCGTCLKAINATLGVDDLFLARKEWVRC